MENAKTVYVIDDEPSIALSLEFLMKQQGHAVRVIEDGAAALDAIAEAPPDLVLLDLMLPSVDGFDVCRRIRARPEGSATKIVIVTARGREADVAKGLALGADDYITKPFAIRDVVRTVQALLR